MRHPIATTTLSAMLSMALSASAATHTWTGAADGDWNNTANWDGAAIPPTNGDGYVYGTDADPTVIVVATTGSDPATGIPDFANHNKNNRTPRFDVQSGSLTMAMGAKGWGGATGSGTIVTVASGASLTWTATKNMVLARDGGAQTYDVNGGFSIDLPSGRALQIGDSDTGRVITMNLDGGSFALAAQRIDGAKSPGTNGDHVSRVNLDNASSWTSTGYLSSMWNDPGTRLSATLVFDVKDLASTVTAAFGGNFPDLDSVNDAIGTVFVSSAAADKLLATDNGDGTFTVKQAGTINDYTWKGAADNDWSNAANWGDNNGDGAGDIPPTNASGYLSGKMVWIIVENGPNPPAANVPAFDGDIDGTPHFRIEDGASLTVAMADAADGPAGAGILVQLGSGSSLAWSSTDSMTLAFDRLGVQTYEIGNGAFAVQTPQFSFCGGLNHTSSLLLDGGGFSVTGNTISGSDAIDPGDDFSGHASQVVLDNGSTFSTTAVFADNLFDSAGNPVLVFDVKDAASKVTAKFGGLFPDLASVHAALGSVFFSSVLGDKLAAFDNADGTFTVQAAPIYTWTGAASDGDWGNAANWTDLDGDGTGDLPPVDANGDLTGSTNWIVVESGPADPVSNVPEFAGGPAGTPRFDVQDGAMLEIGQNDATEGPSGSGAMAVVGSGAALKWSTAGSLTLMREPDGTQEFDVAGDFEIDATRADFGYDAARLSNFSVHGGGRVIVTADELHGTRTPGADFSGGASLVALDGGSAFDAGHAVFHDMADASGNPTLAFDIRDDASSVVGAFGGAFPDIDALNAACGANFLCTTCGGRPEATDNGDGTFTVALSHTFFWTGAAGDGDWINPANWLGGGIPPLRHGALTGDYTGDWNTITIRAGGTGPSINIPPFEGGSGGTPKFVVEPGASLAIAEAGGFPGDYGGPVGGGVLVQIGAGASLTWTDPQKMVLMRHPKNSTQTYEVNGGTFTIETPLLQMGFDTTRLAQINLDGGTMSVVGNRISGNRAPNGDFSGGASQVALSNGAAFVAGGYFDGMRDGAGNPTLVFDLQDSASGVTASFGGAFPDIASVQAAFGVNFQTRLIGVAYKATDNGDGTFTVSLGGAVVPPAPPALEALGFGTGANPDSFYLKATGLDTAGTYILRRSTTLEENGWSDLGAAFTPASAEETLADDNPPAGKAFYRLEEVTQ